MGFADLHIHTVHSWDGTCTVPAVLKYAADFTNLDIIAITDHDCIAGALEAIRLAPRYGIEVIPGCEISTSDGHLLALFIQKPIPAERPLKETLVRVAEQGGICIAAHPGAPQKNSISPQALRQALREPGASEVLVGIESFNAMQAYRAGQRQPDELAEELHLARVASSDSHFLETIGRGATEFSGFLPDDLRRALQHGATRVCVSRSTTAFEKISHWLLRLFMRQMGWVTTNQSPSEPLQLSRFVQSHIKA